MANYLENILRSSNISTITDCFIWMTLIVFILAVILKFNNRGIIFTDYTPTLLTSIGILGTFAGITIGLLGFDVKNIDSSIGSLLEGMKTAFITSLCGIGMSIAYKAIAVPIVQGKNKKEHKKEGDITVLDIYNMMNKQTNSLEMLCKTIGADSESSLIGQFKLLRSDNNDNFKQLYRDVEQMPLHLQSLINLGQTQKQTFMMFEQNLLEKLQSFAEMLSRSATEQVINALKEVIKDFNNNLTEQFGENFKQLNVAVQSLVLWQNNYKQQLQEMHLQYTEGVKAITLTEVAVASIESHSKSIPTSMQNLTQVIKINQHQVEELSRHLDAFKIIRDKAVEAVPEIRQQIDLTLVGVQDATKKISSGLKESSEILKGAIIKGAEDFVQGSTRVNASLQSSSDILSKNSEETKQLLTDAMRDLHSSLRLLVENFAKNSKDISTGIEIAGKTVLQETEKSRKSFEVSIQEMKTSLSNSITEMARTQATEAKGLMAGLSRSIEQTLTDTGESVQKQVVMIDRSMQEEINRVMQEMGRALASISGKFTSDYQELVKKMQLIVNYNGDRK